MKNQKKFEKEIKKFYAERKKNILKDKNLTDRQKTNRVKKNNTELEKALERLENLNNVEDFQSITIKTDWKRNSTWGWNPTCRVWVNNKFAGEDRASGCGYDKESAAAAEALWGNDILIKFLIVNYNRIKEVYGVYIYAGFPRLEISGRGFTPIRSLFAKYYKDDYGKIQKRVRIIEEESYKEYNLK